MGVRDKDEDEEEEDDEKRSQRLGMVRTDARTFADELTVVERRDTASTVSENCWDRCELLLEWVRERVPTPELCPDLSLLPTRTSPSACRGP